MELTSTTTAPRPVFDGLRAGVSPASWRPEPFRDGSAVLVLRRGIVVDHLELVIKPLTPSHWPAFTDLLDQGGPAGRCWCVAPMGIDYRHRAPATNRATLREVVKTGPPPGLLAIRGDLAVGWCGVAPREAVPGLDRPFRTRRVDDVAVWSISCFYIRKGHRRIGIMTALITAAVNYARAGGRTALEAYPLDSAVSSSAADHPNGRSCASNSPAIASEGVPITTWPFSVVVSHRSVTQDFRTRSS